MSLEEILGRIPHRPPFLLIDEIVEESETRILCRRHFRGDEFWYQGHYPDYPLTPGVLLCESALQAGAVLLSRQAAAAAGKVPVATRLDKVQLKQMVRPGDTVEIEVEIREQLAQTYFMTGRIRVAGKLAARLELACTMAAPVASDD